MDSPNIVNLHSMMVPPAESESPAEQKTETALLIEILATVSRLEGIILSQGKQGDSQQNLLGAPIVGSAQLDLAPTLF